MQAITALLSGPAPANSSHAPIYATRSYAGHLRGWCHELAIMHCTLGAGTYLSSSYYVKNFLGLAQCAS
jgi:hypothetical protein